MTVNLEYLKTAKANDEAWKGLEGKYVYSDYFHAWLVVYSVIDMNDWYFLLGRKMYKAKTPLINFVNKGLVSDKPELKRGVSHAE